MKFILKRTSGDACAMSEAIVTDDLENCFIEVADLDGLLALAGKYDCEVVVAGGYPGELPYLEIYDTYRE